MKPSRERKKDRLRQIEVLVADPDPRISRLVRYVLENFGFKNIHMAKDGSDALDILRHKPIDLVITEWPMEPVDGINFVKFVRTSDEVVYRDIPIIMLTGRAEQADVEIARDSGVTEFVVKPFNARTLSHRITQVIDNPRAFIISRDFIGPDRRRQLKSEGADDNRRMPEAEKEKHASRQGNKVIYHIHDQEIIVQKPDRTLKQMIGPDITAEFIFDEDVIREAQNVIMNMKDDFVAWVTIDINRLEHAYDDLRTNPDNKQALKEIAKLALTIKSQAGTFDYSFATSVGKSLYDFAEHIPYVDPLVLLTIRKHIDTLYVIFQKEIHGSGPEISDDVLEGLRLLIQKSRKQSVI